MQGAQEFPFNIGATWLATHALRVMDVDVLVANIDVAHKQNPCVLLEQVLKVPGQGDNSWFQRRPSYVGL